MKLKTALAAIITSALFGGVFALALSIGPAIIYTLTGVNVTQ